MLQTFFVIIAVALLATHVARLGMPKFGSAIVSLYNPLPFDKEGGLLRDMDSPLYIGTILLMPLGAYLAARYRRW